MNQPSNDSAHVWDERPHAQFFGTGSVPAGYRLHGVVLKMRQANRDPGILTVTVRATDGSANRPVGSPGAVLYILSGPASVQVGPIEFTAPAGATLDPDTRYWVVASWSGPLGDGEGVPRWSTARSNPGRGTALDPGAAPGWGIANGATAGFQKAWFGNWGWGASHSALQIAVRGSAINSPATCTRSVSEAPKVGETLTAPTGAVRDPDGLSGAAWDYRWFRVKEGAGAVPVEIEGATGRSYLPVEADLGHVLTVAVGFRDDAGNDEIATCRTAGPAGPSDRGPRPPDPPPGPTPEETPEEILGPQLDPNSPPEFVEFVEGQTARRSVAEHSPALVNVGAPVTATDPDFDYPLMYTLLGADSADFIVDRYSGQILTKQGVTYDRETKPVHHVTVEAVDQRGGKGRIEVAIEIVDVAGPVRRGWLARFGRAVAGQVVEAVEACVRRRPAAGLAVRLAGRPLPAWPAGSAGSAGSEGPARAARHEAAREDRREVRREDRGENQREDRGEFRGKAGAPGRAAGHASQAVTPRDLLTGSSFALSAEAPDGGTVSLRGRGALSRFDGRDGSLAFDGEVGSAMLGADWTRGPGSGSDPGSEAGAWTVGLLLAHAWGAGGWRGADVPGPESGAWQGSGSGASGRISAGLTGLWPWGCARLTPRLALWGVAGYGAGTLTLRPDGGDPVRTGLALAMAAAGLHGLAVEAPAGGGLELAVTADAMAVRTASAGRAHATRLRLGLEGSWRGIAAGGGTLAPRAGIGLRLDGGDAETGYGLEIGAGLAWSHAASGVSAEVGGRGLLTHEASGFRDAGIAAAFAWTPDPASGRGPRLRLTQALGGPAATGTGRRPGRGTPSGAWGPTLAVPVPGPAGAGGGLRMDLRAGWGFAAFGGRFTATPEFGIGFGAGERTVSLGWRLEPARNGPGSAHSLSFEIHGHRRERTDGAAEPEIGGGFRLAARF